MTAFLWRALFAVVIIVLITQNILLWNSSSRVPELATPVSTPEHKSEPVPTSRVPLPSEDKSWIYEPLKDAENFALNREQCDSAFPDLWYEIDRSVNVWKHNISRQITANDTSLEWRDEGAFRALIHRNQLRILETKGIFSLEGSQFPERAVAVWSQIHRALLGATAAGEKLPSIEFSVSVDDRPNTLEDPEDLHTLWAFSRQYKNPSHDRAFVMPDFNFWSWRGVAGSFTEMRARGKDLDEYIPDKIPKAVWRGAVWTNPEVRGPLLKVTKNKSWADVFEFDWMTRDNFIPMEDFCRYAFLVHTEGRSWSGRLKYLLNCDSVTVIHEREWTAHYYSLLVPDGPKQNFVPAKRNFSDLKKKVQYYLNHQNEAQRIADNAVTTFRDRYLTLAAETCYWRRLIEGWNSVAESPEIYEQVQKNVSGEVKNITMLRGVAFEEIVIGRQELSIKVDEPEPEEVAEGEGEGEAADGEATTEGEKEDDADEQENEDEEEESG
jgi:hypothetical protein